MYIYIYKGSFIGDIVYSNSILTRTCVVDITCTIYQPNNSPQPIIFTVLRQIKGTLLPPDFETKILNFVLSCCFEFHSLVINMCIKRPF